MVCLGMISFPFYRPSEEIPDDGATGTFALVHPKGADQFEIIVGNIGDSRTVLGRLRGGRYECVALSEDHKPNDTKVRLFSLLTVEFFPHDPHPSQYSRRSSYFLVPIIT